MAGPSAGEELVATTKKGHKVEILQEKDIWCKVNWADTIAYVRRNNLMIII